MLILQRICFWIALLGFIPINIFCAVCSTGTEETCWRWIPWAATMLGIQVVAFITYFVIESRKR